MFYIVDVCNLSIALVQAGMEVILSSQRRELSSPCFQPFHINIWKGRGPRMELSHTKTCCKGAAVTCEFLY